MRLVHLSDLHLGYRKYTRQSPQGVNQREADVSLAFRAVIDRVIALAPDLLVVAGDVFHAVRPPNNAIVDAFNAFTRLRTALPRCEVVMVAGNHDAPRTSETGSILGLFVAQGVHVVARGPQRIPIPALDLSILAVPDLGIPLPAATRAALVPDPSARHNVLVFHGEWPGLVRQSEATAERTGNALAPGDVRAEDWSYVALGHYHVLKEMAPNAFYCGALEYTSTDPWSELAAERAARLPGKWFIERDLATGKWTPHPVKVARPFLDLPEIAGRGLAAAEIAEALRANVGRAGAKLEGAVVRQVVRDVPRHVARDIDPRLQREVAERTLHFQLDTRRPEPLPAARGQGAAGRRATLADTVRDKLQARVLPSDVDRGRLVALGLEYLARAEVRERAAVAEGTGAEP